MTLQSEDMGNLVAGLDGWIEWSGGENPPEVTSVEVKYRNGETEIRDARRFGWTHWHEAERPNLGAYDIIAFRPAHREADAIDERTGHPTSYANREAQPETDGGGGREYRKTTTIKARQWFKYGDHPAVIRKATPNRHPNEGVPWINTLEGGHVVTPGDWIATGVQGEHWAIKPDVFSATYELATPIPEGQTEGAVARLEKYLAERAKSRQRDPEEIHGMHVGDVREAVLTSSDLRTILAALASKGV